MLKDDNCVPGVNVSVAAMKPKNQQSMFINHQFPERCPEDLGRAEARSIVQLKL